MRGEIEGKIERNLNIKGQLKVELKKHEIKDYFVKDAEIQGSKR